MQKRLMPPPFCAVGHSDSSWPGRPKQNDFEDGAWVTASYARTRVRYRALSFGRDLCRKSQYPMVNKSSQIVHARKLVDIWTAGRNFTWLHSGSKRSESLHSRDQALQREVNFGVGWKAAAPGFLPAGNFMAFCLAPGMGMNGRHQKM